MPLFVRIGVSLVNNWHCSLQSAREVQSQFFKTLGYSKICARWVPRCLTKDHRFQRKIICSELLEHFDVEGDLAPSDFYLFGPIKNLLHGTRFDNDEDVIRAVKKWLHEQDKTWYKPGIHDLVLRCRKAISLDGDYVEK
jgi:hypothetical protein